MKKLCINRLLLGLVSLSWMMMMMIVSVSSFIVTIPPPPLPLPTRRLLSLSARPSSTVLNVISSVDLIRDMVETREREEDATSSSIFTSSSVEYIYTHDDEHLLLSSSEYEDDMEDADEDFTTTSSSSVDYIYTHDDEHFFDEHDDDDSGVVTSSVPTTASKMTKKKIEYMPRSLLPSKETILASSTNRLTRIELQKAIQDVKRFVESRFESDLNVFKVRPI